MAKRANNRPTFRRYHMSLVIRPNGRPGPEQEVQCNATSSSELLARRQAMEIAWSSQYLVSRFLMIREGKEV